MSEENIPVWKRLGSKIALGVFALLVVAGLLAFVSQPAVREGLFGAHAWKVVANLLDEGTQKGPLSVVSAWWNPDTSQIQLSRAEAMSRYQLRLVARSLDNFFRLLLTDTVKVVDHEVFRAMLSEGAHDPFQESHAILKEYLQGNLDVMEISVWTRGGVRVSSMRYKSSPEYLLSPNLLARLDQRDNVLLKHSSTPNLVLVSAIRRKGKVVGAVSQTLSPLFFTKILDFLGVNQHVFYLRNREGDLVVDNYGASQFVARRESGPSYAFYRKFTTAKETSLTLKIDQVDYDLGVIVEKNNLAGHLLAFGILLLCVYLALLIVQLLWKHAGRLAVAAWRTRRQALPSPTEPPAAILSPAAHDALEKELERLRIRESSRTEP
jgi:hypothetical protein